MDKKKIENFMREAYEKGVFTGTWLYAEDGEIISKGAYGFRDPEDSLPVQEDSIFELASVSKQFTAAAVMLLRKRSLISLEDELSKFFPENPYEGITVRHLLNHTCGLPDHEEWSLEALRGETEIPANDLSVRFLKESGLPALFAPGEKWEYSNTAYCLLAEIIGQVSGIPFDEFMRKEIFEPCGMYSTRVCHIRIDGIPFENFARGLVFWDGRYMIPDEIDVLKPYAVMLDGESGVGFVYTNIFDMLAWDRALREEKLLSREEQQLMYTPGPLNSGEVYADEDGDSYGFGWYIAADAAPGTMVFHSGSWPGYNTWYARGIDSDRVMVMLCCREPEDLRGFNSLFEGIIALSMDEEPEPVRTIEDIEIKDPDRSRWESYCGRYEHPEEGDLIIGEVYMKDGDLFAKGTDDDGVDLDFRLYPIGEDTFGRKAGTARIVFRDGCLSIGDTSCRKL